MMMAKVDQFLDDLVKYEKENIHSAVLTNLRPYLEDPEFEPEFVRSKSGAAAGLCSWVINVVKFYEVYCDVEPKRRALKEANAQLQEAEDRLSGIKARVAELEVVLQKLTEQYKEAMNDKVRCQEEADATNATISLANRLVGGLASENVRWGKSVCDLQTQAINLPGDILLVASFIAYLGGFTKQYRVDLLEKDWLPFLKNLNKRATPIPWSGSSSEDNNYLSLLTDDATIAGWNNEGLPSDAMSTENATILTQSIKWPLMIDPQLQGIKWIKSRYRKTLNIIQLDQKSCLEMVERLLLLPVVSFSFFCLRCVSSGVPLLIENMPEEVDPVMEPLLGRWLKRMVIHSFMTKLFQQEFHQEGNCHQTGRQGGNRQKKANLSNNAYIANPG